MCNVFLILILNAICREKVPNTKWTLNDFEIGPCLGQGKFGQVYLAREKRSGIVVALKILLKSEIVLSKTQKQVEREIAIQMSLGLVSD